MKSIGYLLLLGLCAFTMHKFYVSVTTLTPNTPKQRLEITLRLFRDDVETTLQKTYQNPVNWDTDSQKLYNYIHSKFQVKINNKPQTLVFINFELEHDVILVYLKINNVKKYKNITVNNQLLNDYFPDQQHITHCHINGKNSFLLTQNNPEKTLTW